MNLSVQEHFVVFAYGFSVVRLQRVCFYIRVVPNTQHTVLAVVDYGCDLVTFTQVISRLLKHYYKANRQGDQIKIIQRLVETRTVTNLLNVVNQQHRNLGDYAG